MNFINTLLKDLAMAGYDLAERNRRNDILNAVGSFGHQGKYIDTVNPSYISTLNEFDSTADERRRAYESKLN